MENKLLLIIDIGNTNITCGIYQDENLVNTFRLISDKTKGVDDYINDYTTLYANQFVKSKKLADGSVRWTYAINQDDLKTTNNGNNIQTLYVNDETGATIVRISNSRRFSKQDLNKNEAGVFAKFYGNYHYNDYLSAYFFEPEAIEYIENDDTLKDE